MPESVLGIPLLVAVLAVVLGGMVHGALGLGFPLVATPIIALVTDVKTAIILTLAPTLTVNVISILQGGNWGESLGKYWPVALFVLIGSVLGTRLLIVSDPEPFRLVLATIILMYLFTSSLKKTGLWGWIKYYPRVSQIGFGCAAGLMAGTVNIAVPVLIIYFTELALAPLALVQILNLCFLAGKAAQIGTFALFGYLGWDRVLASLILALIAGSTLWIGTLLRRRLDADSYRRWLRKALFVIAGVLIVQFLVGMN